MKTTVQFFSLPAAGIILALLMLPAGALFAGDEFTMETARAAAANGDPKAEYFLGKNYAAGTGVSIDYSKAVEYFRQSANQGYAPAQTALGSCYARGNGVQLDYVKAMQWYLKAAAQKDAMAQYCIGFACAHGKGTPQSMDAAVKWWLRAGQQGQVLAQYSLGQFYFHGTGPGDTNNINFPKAAIWFRKAADQGYAPAMGALGYMYENGVGVKQDWQETLKWSRPGAEMGDATAQDDLGIMYEGGDAGLPVDLVQAYKWFLLSEARGSSLGRHDAIEIEIHQALTPAQMSEARRMTNDFTVKLPNRTAGADHHAQE